MESFSDALKRIDERQNRQDARMDRQEDDFNSAVVGLGEKLDRIIFWLLATAATAFFGTAGVITSIVLKK